MKDRTCIISEYINVYDGSSKWYTQWGEIVGETLLIYSSKTNGKLMPTHTINIKDFDIKPAAVETGRMLAFRLVHHGSSKLLLEPLTILDLGRWISSLFLAIQGMDTGKFGQKHIITSVTIGQRHDHAQLEEDHWKDRTIPHQYLSRHESNLVDVKQMAQMFERMASEKMTRGHDPSSKIRRTRSTPNLIEEKPFELPEKYSNFQTQVTQESLQSDQIEQSNPTPSHQHEVDSSTSKPVIIGVIEKCDKEADIKCWNGPYKAQETEKEVLGNAVNPFLAKQRLTKQEQQIKKIERTINELNESIEKQKVTLVGARKDIFEMQNGTANEGAHLDEILKLENECTLLEERIQESEQNVDHYKTLIHQIEDDMVHLSTTINWTEDQSVSQEVSASCSDLENTEKTISSTNGTPTHNGHHNHNEDYEPFDDIDGNKSAPEWAKQAKEKSKNAYKILSEQGILY